MKILSAEWPIVKISEKVSPYAKSVTCIINADKNDYGTYVLNKRDKIEEC